MVEARDEEVAATPAAPPPGRAAAALATLAVVIAAACMAGLIWVVLARTQLEKKISALESDQTDDERGRKALAASITRLGNAVTLLSDEQVDLGNSKLQHLRHGFAVSELTTARQDTGVAVQGRLINASSLRYRDITFRVKAGNSAQEFAIRSLPPGTSGEFSVVLPNLPMEEARTATFFLVSSAVEYDR